MIMRTVAFSLVTMLALTGCQSDIGDATTAKPPAGGWPQPEGGKFTAAMCGLLTAADYKPLGHNLIGSLQLAPGKDSSNFVSCVGTLGEWLTLDLQPTAEAAKIRYDRSLESRKDTVVVEKQQSILAQDLLQGVDQSWFDYGPAPSGTKPGNYQLRFRRGSLVASVEIDPVGDNSVKDPKAAVLTLAGLVLERIPEVGKADSGTTPKVRFEVKGNGRAFAINYNTDESGGSLKDVQLPWSIELPASDHGDSPVWLKVSANATASPLHLECSISVRATVVKQTKDVGIVLCDTRSPVK
ncbi:MAG TPA: hypothetical protein VFC19_39640 [Candidatus Limnocylindrales bacterium]|nr:hypothetical protein [Candidatus Limnocylindrales bacterium]